MTFSTLASTDIFRIFFSVGGLIFFWGISLLFPYRNIKKEFTWNRWKNNLFFNFFNALVVKILAPLTLIQIAQSEGPITFSLPLWLKILLGILVLDVVIYWQHRFFHKYPLLWRLHRVHHCDVEFDTTTAGRFHTIEILISFGIKAFFVFLLPIPAQAVLIFEILLNFSSLFNHSNFEFPQPLEKIIRLFVITPHLHRVHHSTRREEMNSNFGFSVSWWDFLFGSLKLDAKELGNQMDIGLKQWRQDKDQKLWNLIINPFLADQKNKADNSTRNN